MIRRPPRSTLSSSSAASDVYKRQDFIQNQFSMGMQQFEQEVKSEIAQRKLLALINGAVSVSDKDVAEEVQKQGVKVKFEYAVLTLDDVKKQIKPTDAELKAFYEQNK